MRRIPWIDQRISGVVVPASFSGDIESGELDRQGFGPPIRASSSSRFTILLLQRKSALAEALLSDDPFSPARLDEEDIAFLARMSRVGSHQSGDPRYVGLS